MILDYQLVTSDPTLRLTDPQAFQAMAAEPPEVQYSVFAATVLGNSTVAALLERLASLDLPPWFLTAGSLFQTCWNAASSIPNLNHGIRDHDLFYYDDTDLSWDAEDAVIKYVEAACSDVAPALETRNEARVHLWYEQKFGKRIKPFRNLYDAIDAFPATCCCVAIHLDAGGKLTVYTTHGFADLFTMTLRPNPLSIAPSHVFEAKARRWMSVWPQLVNA